MRIWVLGKNSKPHHRCHRMAQKVRSDQLICIYFFLTFPFSSSDNTPAEALLFQDLRDCHFGYPVRLEQERVL